MFKQKRLNTMSQPDSNPITTEAISARMNASLNPKGITATVRRDAATLKVVFTAVAPNQKGLAEYARRAIGSLKLPDVKTVIVYGLRNGEKRPDWRERIELMVEPELPAVVEPESTSMEPKTLAPMEPVKGAIALIGTGIVCFLLLGWIFSACSAFFAPTEGEKITHECSQNLIKRKQQTPENIRNCAAIGKDHDRRNGKQR